MSGDIVRQKVPLLYKMNVPSPEPRSPPFSSEIFIANSFESLEAAHYLKDWDLLAQSMPTQMPFQSMHWNRSWWANFQRKDLFCKDSLHLLCAVREERLVGVVPLFVTKIGLPGITLFRYLRLLGADANLTEWRSVICEPQDRIAMQAIWLRHAINFSAGLGFVQVRGFSVDEIAAANLGTSRYAKILSPSENFVLALDDHWDTFKHKLKRNIKESLRHCYNSLAHAELHPALHVIDDSETMRSKMPMFYHWHALRAKSTKSVAHPDYFKYEKHRQFLDSLTEALCPDGQMKLFELTLNDQPVAYRLGFINGETLYLYLSAYDPEYAKFSTMTTLVAEVIQWAIKNKLRFVNLSFGRDVSKTRWSPREVVFYEALIGTGGIRLLLAQRWLSANFRKLKRSSTRVWRRMIAGSRPL